MRTELFLSGCVGGLAAVGGLLVLGFLLGLIQAAAKQVKSRHQLQMDIAARVRTVESTPPTRWVAGSGEN